MTWLLTVIPKRLIVELLAAATLLAMLWVSRMEVAHLRIRVDTAEASTKAALDAYRSEAATVATQRQALLSWQEKAEAAEAASQNALSDAIKAKADLATAQKARHQELSSEAKNPDCAAVLAIDLRGSCPTHARRLLSADPVPR